MKYLLVLAVFVFSVESFGQAFTGEGDNKVQVGYTAWGFGTGIRGTYDYGVYDIFSVGAGAEFFFTEDDNDDRNFYAFVRSNAHLGEILNLPWNVDVYPGIDFGITGDGLGVGAHVGARYFFSKKFGVYAEIGSRGSFGVSINL